MKTAAYIALHYGKDYLEYSLKSIYNSVDQIFVLYTPNPSHGTGSSLQCPDTKTELFDILKKVDVDDKIEIYQGAWPRENDQRNYAHSIAKAKGVDILVLLDFDEVWKPGVLDELIKLTYDRKASKCLIWMRHLWRSFNYICDDPMRQERIYYLGDDKKDLIYAPQPENQVWHFGYAREVDQVGYKISCHGHTSEWLTSKEEWFERKYKQFPPDGTFVHPCCKDVWFPKPFDKKELPQIMKSHPYWNNEVI